jgi:hypothetical protein
VSVSAQVNDFLFAWYFDPKKFGPKFLPKKGRKVGNCLDLTKVRAVGLALYS